MDCKTLLAKNLNEKLAPFRQKRAEIAAQPQMVDDVLNEGARRARAIAQQTMNEVRAAVGLP